MSFKPPKPKTPEPDDPVGPAVAAWQLDPSPANADAMLKHLGPAIDGAVKQYGGGYSGPALKAKAKVITLDALQKYQPDRGPVVPFLRSHLQGLRRFSGQETAAIPVSERSRLAWNQLQRHTAELADELGRDPTDLELADYARLPPKKIKEIRRSATSGAAEGMYGDAFGVAVDAPDETWQRFLYLTLTPAEQFIMEHTLGLNGKPVLGTKELAKKLGVTAPAVSQRKAKIQQLLDSRRMG